MFFGGAVRLRLRLDHLKQVMGSSQSIDDLGHNAGITHISSRSRQCCPHPPQVVWVSYKGPSPVKEDSLDRHSTIIAYSCNPAQTLPSRAAG